MDAIRLVNRKVADKNDDPWTAWDKTRAFIEVDEIVNDIDEMFDDCDTEDEAWELFEEEVMEFINEAITPAGYEFGYHAKTEHIGFWDEGDIAYDDFEAEENPEEEDQDDEEEEEEEEEQEGKGGLEDGSDWSEGPNGVSGVRFQAGMEEGQGEPEEKQDKEEVGVAEVLDSDGKVVAESTFTRQKNYFNKVCARCGKHMDKIGYGQYEGDTHSMCDKCAKEYQEEIDSL